MKRLIFHLRAEIRLLPLSRRYVIVNALIKKKIYNKGCLPKVKLSNYYAYIMLGEKSKQNLKIRNCILFVSMM